MLVCNAVNRGQLIYPWIVDSVQSQTQVVASSLAWYLRESLILNGDKPIPVESRAPFIRGGCVYVYRKAFFDHFATSLPFPPSYDEAWRHMLILGCRDVELNIYLSSEGVTKRMQRRVLKVPDVFLSESAFPREPRALVEKPVFGLLSDLVKNRVVRISLGKNHKKANSYTLHLNDGREIRLSSYKDLKYYGMFADRVADSIGVIVPQKYDRASWKHIVAAVLEEAHR